MAKKRPPKKQNKKQNLAFKLIILGLLIFLLGTISHVQIFFNSLYLSFREAPKKEFKINSPSKVIIKSAGIDAEVEEGGIAGGQWLLSDKKALFLPTSGKIGEGYNTIIYAHNWTNLFANLRNVKKDDRIIIKDREGKDFAYTIYSIERISPRDIKALYAKEKNVLTLFTCDGWYDQERLLVRAKLIEQSISSQNIE